MTDGTDTLGGDVRLERGAQRGQVQVAVDPAELGVLVTALSRAAMGRLVVV